MELNDSNDEKITSISFHELLGFEQQSVKTNIENDGVSHQHQHLIDEKVKLEIVETDMKRECFPDGIDDLVIESSPVVQSFFICDYCKRAFTTPEYLKKHTRKCRYRVYALPSTSNVSVPTVLHKKPKLMRDQEGLYQCYHCDYKFKSQVGLRLHARTHSGVNLHTCRECSKQFTLPSNLARHMFIHINEKPHKCTQCEAAFNRADHLKMHMLTHSGLRAHKCTVCGKSFTHSFELTVHMRTHTGEKPYQCTICNRAFTRNSILRRHMKTHYKKTGNNRSI